jgi:glucose/arabinose dehydrogenase
MRSVALLAVIALTGAANLETQGCGGGQSSSPAASEVFTTGDGVRFRVEVVVNGLEIPWSLVFAPDGRLFVPERPGRVRIIDVARGSSELALTLDDVFTEGEAGLLGLALDPAFASNRLLYAYYTARTAGGAVNRVVRYRESSGRLGEPVVILDGIPANTVRPASSSGQAPIPISSYTGGS